MFESLNRLVNLYKKKENMNANQVRKIQEDNYSNEQWDDFTYYVSVINFTIEQAALHTKKTSFCLLIGNFTENKDLIDQLTEHFEKEYFKVELFDVTQIHFLRISW